MCFLENSGQKLTLKFGFQINVWSETPSDCQLQVSNQTYNAFKQYCVTANITMEVLINDVKEAIEKQYLENLKEKQRWGLNNNSFDYDAFNSFSDVSLKGEAIPGYFAKKLL